MGLIKPETHSKYTNFEIQLKKRFKALRLAMGLTVNDGAKMMKMTRKQFEDFEATRGYGSFSKAVHIHTFCRAYKMRYSELLQPLEDEFY